MWLGIAVIIGLIVGVCLLSYITYRDRKKELTYLSMLPSFLITAWAVMFAACLFGVIIIPSDGMVAYLEEWVWVVIAKVGLFITVVYTICYFMIVPWFVLLERYKERKKGAETSNGGTDDQTEKS